MSFFFRPAFYPERPIYSSTRPSISDDEAYYRRVAEEHQRRAQAALALAQEEERRRRQAAAQRLYREDTFSRPEYRPEYVHTRPHYPHAFDFPSDLYDSQHPPRYEHLPDVPQRPPSPIPRSREQIARDDHERQIEEWLQRRRQRELEEAEFRRLKELERRRDDELMREMLAAFGIDSLQRTRATPVATSSPRLARRPLEEEPDNTTTPRQAPTQAQTCTCGRHIPSPQPVRVPEQASTPSTSSSPDFAAQLWNALSGGRSDEERANILRELGVGLPFNVSLGPNTRRPAPEQQRPTPAQQTTAAPKPTTPKPQPQERQPAPIRVPVVVRSPAPATPQPKAAPSPSPSPAPVKLSPFAHIESIQTKFDSLRASTPDLSNQQKKREYLAELNKLLTSLDSVESSGSEGVRGARKALVRAVEEELEKVEGNQDEEKPEQVVEEKPVEEKPVEEKPEEAAEEKSVEEKPVEETSVDAQEEEKPVVVEAAPEPQASAEHVPEEVEIRTVSDPDWAQVHPAEATIEEPVSPTTTQPSEPAQAESETHAEAPATVPNVTVSTSDDSAKPEVDVNDEEVHDVKQGLEEQPERGRQPAVTSQAPKSPKARRPRSVEIEEVPDEESLSGSPRVGNKDL